MVDPYYPYNNLSIVERINLIRQRKKKKEKHIYKIPICFDYSTIGNLLEIYNRKSIKNKRIILLCIIPYGCHDGHVIIDNVTYHRLPTADFYYTLEIPFVNKNYSFIANLINNKVVSKSNNFNIYVYNKYPHKLMDLNYDKIVLSNRNNNLSFINDYFK